MILWSAKLEGKMDFLFFIFYISTANYNQPIIVKIKNKK